MEVLLMEMHHILILSLIKKEKNLEKLKGKG